MVGYFYLMKLWKALLPVVVIQLYSASCISTQKKNDKVVFYYNESGSVQSLDPAYSTDLESMWIINQLFDGLVALDSNLNPTPLIAKRWTISTDQKTYQFYLRNDVWFHPFQHKTRKVKASDFVFSFNRILQPEVASPGKWIFESCQNENPFVAINDTLLEIRLNHPQGAFLQLLSTVFANVVMPEAVQILGEKYRTSPIGTGPFVQKFWEKDVAMVLHKNEQYWMRDESGKKLPYLDAVKIDFVKDAYAEFQGLMSGKYDFMSGLDANFIDELLTKEGELKNMNDGITLYKTAFIKTDYIGFLLDNNSNDIIQDRSFRALLYNTTPRKTICQLRNQMILPAERGFVPPMLLNAEITNSSKEAGKQPIDSLLTELHSRWGKPLPPITLTITPEYTDIFEVIQKQWSTFGIVVNLQVLQSSTFKESVAKGKVNMFRKNWLADFPDAENFLQIFTKPLWSPNGANYTHYHNAEVESGFQKASQIADPAIRKKMFQEIESRILRDYPVIPLYHDQVVHFVRNNIKNWSVNGVNQIDLTKVKKERLN